jgi:ATP-dependent RNA helicase DeaD
VAALLRLLRARIPAPEDLIPLAAPRANDRAPAPPPSGQARPPRPPKGAPRDFGPEAVRFRVALGRRNKADPKWLLPLLCRAAGVERTEIGRIEIGDRDSTFDVSAAAAERFRVASRSQGQEARITEVSSRRKK